MARIKKNDGQISQRIGRYIRSRRREVGITQNELGRRLGYDYGNFIAMLERGASKFPLERWGDYARALQIPEEHWHRFLMLMVEDQLPDFLPYVVFKPHNAQSYFEFPAIDQVDAPVIPYEDR